MIQAPTRTKFDFDLTVIVPAHNEEIGIASFLERCIESIPESLRVEILVIDDGSVDLTATIVRSLATLNPCIRLLSSEERGGLAAALSKGIEASRGSHVTWLPADNAFGLTDLLSNVPSFMSKSDFYVFVRSSTSDSRPLIRRLVTLTISILMVIRFRFWVANYSGIFLGQSSTVRRFMPNSRSIFFTYELLIRAKRETKQIEVISLKAHDSRERKSRIFEAKSLLRALLDFVKFSIK